MKPAKPIKSRFDMTPEEKKVQYVNAGAVAMNHVKDLVAEGFRTKAFEHSGSLEELANDISAATEVLRETLMKELPKGKKVAS